MTRKAWSIGARVSIEPKHDEGDDRELIFTDEANMQYDPSWSEARCAAAFLRGMADEIEDGGIEAEGLVDDSGCLSTTPPEGDLQLLYAVEGFLSGMSRRGCFPPEMAADYWRIKDWVEDRLFPDDAAPLGTPVEDGGPPVCRSLSPWMVCGVYYSAGTTVFIVDAVDEAAARERAALIASHEDHGLADAISDPARINSFEVHRVHDDMSLLIDAPL